MAWVICVSLATTFLSHRGYLDALNFIWLDALFSVSEPVSADAIRVLGAADDDFSRLGLSDPPSVFPRERLADIVRALAVMKPRLIALDIILDQPSDDEEADRSLADALAEARADGIPVVVASRLTDDGSRLIPCLPQFGGAQDQGFANIQKGDDWVVRATLESIEVDGQVIFSLAGRIAQRLRAALTSNPEAAAPRDPAGRPVLIDFTGAGESYPPLSVADLLEGLLPAEFFADRIVLVGRTDIAAGDLHLIPVRDRSATSTGERIRLPGVRLQAHCVNTMIGHSHLKRASVPVDLAVQVGAGALVVLMLVLWGPRLGALGAFLLLILVALPLSIVLFDSGTYWLNIVPTTIALTAYSVAITAQYQARRRRLLTGLVGRDAARVLLRRRADFLAQSAVREVVVLFVDLTDSAGMALELTPSAFRRAINVFYGHVCEAVWRHGGMVNKFLGDGVMCLFGALPDEAANEAPRALEAAKDIVTPSPRTAQDWRESAGRPFRLRVALAKGPALVGNLGTADRFDFTAVGDTINTAFRMIHLPHDDASPTYIWVTQQVLDAHDPGWERVKTHSLQVSDSHDPMPVYELAVSSEP